MTTTRSATVETRGDREILIEREFDAPPALVWEAWTRPEHVRRWWAGQRGVVTSCEIDLRIGGTWRWVMEAGGGLEVAFHGEYRELVPGERIVCTEVFEGMPEGAALNTMTFAALEGGRTRLTIRVAHERREHRDAHLASGMEGGMQESFDLLEQVAVGLGG